jgi:hypothetical protein
MKTAAAFLSLALLTTSLTPNASAEYAFPISQAIEISFSWKKAIDVQFRADVRRLAEKDASRPVGIAV